MLKGVKYNLKWKVKISIKTLNGNLEQGFITSKKGTLGSVLAYIMIKIKTESRVSH